MIPWDRNRKAYDNILDAIGQTPLVRLGRVTKGLEAGIFGKLEYFSPSGSLKDRIYRQMLLAAQQRGELKPGMTIIEGSTGNAGIACSFVGSVLGYPVIVVMPEGMSEERKMLIRSYGAELIFTPGGESDVDLVLERIEEIRSKEPARYFFPGQFGNEDNIVAHYETTGPEIWEQTGGQVDAFIASQGTGGTLSGVGRYLKERNPNLKLFAIEPAECALLSRREWGEHAIEGIGDGFVPRNLDLSLLDGIVTTTSSEAIDMARRMSREEGLFVGISSGCNVAGAIKLARKLPELRTVVTMLNDTGQRYFSTALCGAEKHVESPDRDHPMDDYTRRELDAHQGRWEIID
ncbi:MAG: PLP-dependent cysteine synthase family protein [Chloroflexi bacterium]|nr:PLP-dependent cysteine synthase family protein [Chloroflexota bacterium]